MTITDDGHEDSKEQHVSYVVVSVPHCAFLQQDTVTPEEKFTSCVNNVGLNVSNGLTVCEKAEWLTRL